MHGNTRLIHERRNKVIVREKDVNLEFESKTRKDCRNAGCYVCTLVDSRVRDRRGLLTGIHCGQLWCALGLKLKELGQPSIHV